MKPICTRTTRRVATLARKQPVREVRVRRPAGKTVPGDGDPRLCTTSSLATGSVALFPCGGLRSRGSGHGSPDRFRLPRIARGAKRSCGLEPECFVTSFPGNGPPRCPASGFRLPERGASAKRLPLCRRRWAASPGPSRDPHWRMSGPGTQSSYSSGCGCGAGFGAGGGARGSGSLANICRAMAVAMSWKVTLRSE